MERLFWTNYLHPIQSYIGIMSKKYLDLWNFKFLILKIRPNICAMFRINNYQVYGRHYL